jgi:hypothetical protein
MTIKFYYNGNITTRKFPRTLAEAFPESQNNTFEDGMDKEDKLVVVACVIAAAILFVMVFGGVL